MNIAFQLPLETSVERKPLEGKLIIAVDNDPSQLQVFYKPLQKVGGYLIGLTDPKIFLKLLDSNHPDLVILKVLMPEMDGWETFQRMREMPRYINTPVIFLVPLETTGEDFLFSPGIGHCCVLSTPVPSEKLISTINHLLTSPSY